MKKASNEVEWYPEHIGKLMQDWLDNMDDWNISRRRFWGLPLMCYECIKCENVEVIEKIEKLIKELPIEVNAFDLLYLNGKSLIEEPFEIRTKLLRKLIIPKKYKFGYSHQLITDNEVKAEKFYKEALKDNQEGIMIKNLKSPYKPGARVGHMLKYKPDENELDLIITRAEYGKGKRVGIFSSFTLSCKDKDNNLLEIGKASTGLKEKSELASNLRYGLLLYLGTSLLAILALTLLSSLALSGLG